VTILDIGIVGSRTITSYEALEHVLRDAPRHWMEDPRFVSGGADGVDTLAERYAARNEIPIEVIEPDWNDWSRGHPAKVRNTDIVEASDGVIALWDGQSEGTRDTMDKCLNKGVPLYMEIR